MKYLIVEDFSGGVIPFIFPDRVDHADFNDVLPYGKVVSAGYVALKNGAPECTGLSKELGVKARPEDAGISAAALSGTDEY